MSHAVLNVERRPGTPVPIGRVPEDFGIAEYRIAPSPGAARYLPEGWIVERRHIQATERWVGNSPTPFSPCTKFVYPDVNSAAVALWRVLWNAEGFVVSPFAPPPFNPPARQSDLFGHDGASDERTIPQAAGQLSLFTEGG